MKAPGLTRRELMRGALRSVAGAALLLKGCSGIEGKCVEDLDPRVPALMDSTISLDMHTHAAGAGFSRVPRYDLAGVNEVSANYADLPPVANLLLKQGFSPQEASKLLGGNYWPIFKKALADRKAA